MFATEVISESSVHMIPIWDAYCRWRDVTGYANSFNWFRKHRPIPGTVKVSGRWMVDECQLDEVLDAVRRQQAARRQATEDYRQHVLHPGIVNTEWGSYQAGEQFHTAYYRRPGEPDTVVRYCNNCVGPDGGFVPASTEHDKPECHRCRDWSPCGQDCTLSRIYCQSCQATLKS
jgi:hypothetical protein